MSEVKDSVVIATEKLKALLAMEGSHLHYDGTYFSKVTGLEPYFVMRDEQQDKLFMIHVSLVSKGLELE